MPAMLFMVQLRVWIHVACTNLAGVQSHVCTNHVALIDFILISCVCCSGRVQHMTGIEAVWHPLIPDVFSCGRYGGSDVERGIDIMQASTGKTLWHMKSKDLPGVTPINVFSPNGRWLVSASGHNVHAWRSCNDDQDPNTIGTQMSSSKRKIFENIKGAEKKNIAFQRVPGMYVLTLSPSNKFLCLGNQCCGS